MLINECSFKTIVLIGDLFIFGNWTYDNYEGEDIIQELDGNNQIVSTFTHGPGIDEPISVEKNGQKYYYISDGLGSITAIVDQNGNIVQTYRYNSFGNIISTTGSLNQLYTYTGREYDSETGLYYYRARYYDAHTGRFLQEDPIWDDNLYSYCGNDPINYYDPLGLSKSEVIVKGAYKFIKYVGDVFHGGEHWHVFSRKTGELLGRISVNGEILTGSIPNKALKILTKLGKIAAIGGVVTAVAMDLLNPTDLSADDTICIPENIDDILRSIEVSNNAKNTHYNIR